MKHALLLSTLLLSMATLTHVCAQTRPANAPARKPATAAKPTVSKPATAASTSSKPTTKSSSTVIPAQNRANSEKLPAPVAVAPATTAPPKPAPPRAKPQPTPPATQPPARSYARTERGLAYAKGDNLLNVGVGLSSYYYGNPLGISFELGVDKDISVGGQFDYNSGNYGDNYYNNSRWRYTSTYFGLRGSYHFNRILRLNTRKLDLYAGLGLGYRTFRWNDSNYGSGYDYDYSSGLFVNYFLGGKYYFSDKFGAFLELGYTGLSSSRIGLSAKF